MHIHDIVVRIGILLASIVIMSHQMCNVCVRCVAFTKRLYISVACSPVQPCKHHLAAVNVDLIKLICSTFKDQWCIISSVIKSYKGQESDKITCTFLVIRSKCKVWLFMS